MMLNPDVRRVLDGTSIAHIASVLPDGAPHSVPVWIGTHGGHVAILTGPGSRKARNLRRDPRVALSLTPADNPFQPIVIRGRVVEWLEGDRAWEIIDRISTKYTGDPYPRGEERVVALIEPDRGTQGGPADAAADLDARTHEPRVKLRRALPEDASAIGAVFDAAVRSGWTYLGERVAEPMFTPDDWDQLVADHQPPNVLLVAVDDTHCVVGYTVARPDHGEMFLLFVHPAHPPGGCPGVRGS